MESWDDEDFEPKVVPAAVVVSNKWEGEDEDDEVKESWEDEDEEQQKVEELKESAAPKPKKKVDRIAEREKQKREEHLRRLKEQEEEEEEMSPEEKLKRQKESDLEIALETTFGGSNSSSTGLDALCPASKEEFQEFVDIFTTKVQPFAKSAEYPAFAENLIRNICATLSSLDIKKVKTTIDNLYLEKQKIEKGDKTRKSKAKGKAKLKLDNDNQFSAYVDDYDEFDDFM